MASAAEMGVAETYNRTVFMLITSTIFINPWLLFTVNVMRNGIGVGTQLHDAERRTGTRKSVSHAIGSYDWIDILDVIFGRFVCRDAMNRVLVIA